MRLKLRKGGAIAAAIYWLVVIAGCLDTERSEDFTGQVRKLLQLPINPSQDLPPTQTSAGGAQPTAVVPNRLVPVNVTELAPTECDFTKPDDEQCPDKTICGPVDDKKAGICAAPPIGGVYVPNPKKKFPVPVAFVPLTGTALASWPDSRIVAAVRGPIWTQDKEFGSVLHCKQDAKDVVFLQSVPYGRKGPFTINLWVKKDLSTKYFGDTHQYIFSHASVKNANSRNFSPTEPNQIHIYLPEKSHPAHGLIRVAVKDSDDDGEQFFLDSDGTFNNDKPRELDVFDDHVQIDDGQWHMVTVTSNPKGKKGFRLYVDGVLAGATPKRGNADGGDPLKLDGNVFLCGRVDGNPQRHFDGSVAKLSFFDDALSPDQIEAMFKLVKEATESREFLGAKELPRGVFEAEDKKAGLRFARTAEPDVALAGASVIAGESVNRASPPFDIKAYASKAKLCFTDPSALAKGKKICKKSEICAPVHKRILKVLLEETDLPDDDKFGRNGVCVEKLKGNTLIPSTSEEVPIPLAFFPLSGGSVSSWPVPNAGGVSANVAVEDGGPFGSVFQCSQANASFIILDNVPYGDSGRFGVNFWFKPEHLKGDIFQYLYSHSGVLPSINPFKENQLQIYIPEDNHTAYGVIRTILKDSKDVNSSTAGQIYVDTNGDVSLTGPEVKKDPDLRIDDGKWHMLTVSTRPDLKKGYSVYLDGELVGEIEEGVVYTGTDGVVRPAVGGEPFRPGGKIYLCGRNDGEVQRHFQGEIVQVALYDVALSAEQVETLYSTAVDEYPDLLEQPELTELDEEMHEELEAAVDEEGPPANGEPEEELIRTEPSTSSVSFNPDADEDDEPVSDLDRRRLKQQPVQEITRITPTTPTTPTGQPLPAGVQLPGSQIPGSQFPGAPGSQVPPTSGMEDVAVTGGGESVLELGPRGSWLGEIDAVPGDRYGPCTGNSPQPDSDVILCRKGLTCVPVLTPAEGATEEDELERVGVCVNYPQRGAYVFDPDNEIMPPIAYFPLTGGNLDSWPFPEFRGRGTNNLHFIDDEVFGSVMDCRQDQQDQVVLDPVDYAGEGGFTLNFWFRKRDHHNTEGKGYQFMFSHTKEGLHSGIRNDSQIQVELPESGHQLFGLIRGVVKDSDDVDDGTSAPPVFLDSDGVVGDNTFRDSVTENGSIYTDGNWHMVTLTTHEDESQGFSMYLDGFLVGDVNKETAGGRDIPGGDPIDLSGPIHLCGRADQRPDRHFDGSIAHLALWDGALSSQEIFVLFERFIIAAEGMQIVHPNRFTVEGDQCLFPGILKGQLVIDCAPLDNTLKCPVRNGSWVECEPFRASEPAISQPDVTQIQGAVRLTVDGEKCRFPTTYQGTPVFDCILIQGAMRCETRTGIWKECAETVPIRYTENGETCVFPFTHKGKTYMDCAEIDGIEKCKSVSGELEECASKEAPASVPPTPIPAPTAAIPPEDQGPTPLEDPPPVTAVASGRITSRVTVDGDACKFPFWHKGKSVADCVEADGVEKCQIPSGELKECAPQVFTMTGTPCAFPFADEDDATESITSCVEKDGKDMCKTAEGGWEVCGDAPLRETEPAQPLLLPGRVTVDGDPCMFPFWYKGKLVSTCIDADGTPGASGGQCRAESGTWAECAPVRSTITGHQCSVPFAHNEETFTDCVDVDGSEQCKIADGTFEKCAPPPPAPIFGTNTLEEETEEEPETRMTVTGEQCVLPFVFNGKAHNECIRLNGTESCKIYDGTWAECAPIAPLKIYPRVTVDGENCTMPFEYKGRLNTDCMALDGKQLCEVPPYGTLKECAPLVGNLDLIDVELEIDNLRETKDGQTCKFPFTYEGSLWIDCVVIDETESCKVANGNWSECAPAEKLESEEASDMEQERPSRITVEGEECNFPFQYNGEDQFDCVELDGVESCQVANGDWSECAPADERPSRITVAGEECKFPFQYNGEDQLDCVEIDGVESCQIDGEWVECAVDRSTVSGIQCRFPFEYNGNAMTECIEIGGVESCKNMNDTWEECKPHPQVDSSGQRTASGRLCRFPFEYEGKDATECVPGENGVKVCAVASGDLEECAKQGSERARVTVDGKSCVFPFPFEGSISSDCVNRNGKDMCMVDIDGEEWGECKPAEGVKQIRLQQDNQLEVENEGEIVGKKEKNKLSSQTLTGAIIGGVLLLVMLIAIIAIIVVWRRKRADKNYEHSSKNFQKFEEEQGEGGGNIAMAAMGSARGGSAPNGQSSRTTLGTFIRGRKPLAPNEEEGTAEGDAAL